MLGQGASPSGNEIVEQRDHHWVGERPSLYRNIRIRANSKPLPKASRELIEALHDSEIKGEIGWFFDGVWRAKIGDPWNGYVTERDGFLSLKQAARWLWDQALHHYPDSEFAKEYLRAHSGYQPQYPPEFSK